MQIGNLNLTGKVVLAPLAGVSNRPFRLLARRSGAACTYTEMVSADGISRGQKKTLGMMQFEPDERPIGVQLFGAKPDVMYQAALRTVRDFNPDIIDMNFGCPVKKVVNKNGGAAVLKDMKLTDELVRACVEGAGGVPVTIKMRTGWESRSDTYLEAGTVAERAGAVAICLHARSRSQGYSGRADWATIKRLKESVGVTVIGNGDVRGPADAGRMLSETGCDGVMIGRAAMDDPEIFSRVNHYLETGVELPPPTAADRLSLACRHAGLMTDHYGAERGAIMMRKYLGWYVKGLPGASRLRPRLFRVSSLHEIESLLAEYLDQLRRKAG